MDPQAAVDNWTAFWNSVRDFFLTPDTSGMNYLTRILISVAIIVIAYILIKVVTHLIKKALYGKKKLKGLEIDLSAKFFVINVVKILLWIGVAFLVIGILKIDTTGIAGITSAVTVALGLALQDVIGCFASGVILLHQKNISAGDFIAIENSYGHSEGIVTKVQFFFTYLMTPGGQEITIPNNNMLKAATTNFTRLGKRRIDYDVQVDYDADVILAKKVLNDLVENDPRRLKEETFTVYVYNLGEYSVGIRLRLWTTPDDYWPLYNELSEKILLAFRENNLHIPSSTERYVKNVD